MTLHEHAELLLQRNRSRLDLTAEQIERIERWIDPNRALQNMEEASGALGLAREALRLAEDAERPVREKLEEARRLARTEAKLDPDLKNKEAREAMAVRLEAACPEVAGWAVRLEPLAVASRAARTALENRETEFTVARKGADIVAGALRALAN